MAEVEIEYTKFVDINGGSVRVLRDEILENDEEVLGNIPMVTIAGNYYKVFVTTKRLIFDWTGGHGPIETMSLHPKLAFNELSYADITKVEITRYWKMDDYNLIIWVLTKGLIKKLKQKKLFEGNLSPPGNYLEDKKSLGLNEKEAKREYAIEVENLLNSVLKDKIAKGVDLKIKASLAQPSRYFSYAKLPDNKDIDWAEFDKETAKQIEGFRKMEKNVVRNVIILAIIGGIILMVCCFWLIPAGTLSISLAVRIFGYLGIVFVGAGIMGLFYGGVLD